MIEDNYINFPSVSNHLTVHIVQVDYISYMYEGYNNNADLRLIFYQGHDKKGT